MDKAEILMLYKNGCPENWYDDFVECLEGVYIKNGHVRVKDRKGMDTSEVIVALSNSFKLLKSMPEIIKLLEQCQNTGN